MFSWRIHRAAALCHNAQNTCCGQGPGISLCFPNWRPGRWLIPWLCLLRIQLYWSHRLFQFYLFIPSIVLGVESSPVHLLGKCSSALGCTPNSNFILNASRQHWLCWLPIYTSFSSGSQNPEFPLENHFSMTPSMWIVHWAGAPEAAWMIKTWLIRSGQVTVCVDQGIYSGGTEKGAIFAQTHLHGDSLDLPGVNENEAYRAREELGNGKKQSSDIIWSPRSSQAWKSLCNFWFLLSFFIFSFFFPSSLPSSLFLLFFLSLSLSFLA
jgi:hypothetical protein